ncbi:hypothetical protein GOODEAATRI_028034 [Goodea atripinnis]|uniref:Microtubule-associated protein 215 n=1 Tax=Goodea atripinnis TaxID=208336 RepID=A0ABV0MLG4_9TELE
MFVRDELPTIQHEAVSTVPLRKPCGTKRKRAGVVDVMGGKKKKSAAQTAAAAAASSGSTPAVGGTGAVVDQKIHTASSKASKPAKENKSKGGDIISGYAVK